MILRPIEPPATIERELQAITRRIVAAWSRELREAILPAYSAALDRMQRDEATDPVEAAIEGAESELGRLEAELIALLGVWVLRVETWHRRRFAALVKGGARLDVSAFLSRFDLEDEIAAVLERNAGLMKGLSDNTRKEISQIVYQGILDQTPRRTIGKQISRRLAIARNRADLIARDQTAKLASELDRLRQQQAGIEEYIWRTARDERVRSTHAAQEGKRHRWDTPVPGVVRPGYEINCRCKARAYVEVD